MVRPNALAASLPRSMTDRQPEPDSPQEAFRELRPSGSESAIPGDPDAEGGQAAEETGRRGEQGHEPELSSAGPGGFDGLGDRSTDHDLIRLAQEGDEDAFGRLVRRHQHQGPPSMNLQLMLKIKQVIE